MGRCITSRVKSQGGVRQPSVIIGRLPFFVPSSAAGVKTGVNYPNPSAAKPSGIDENTVIDGVIRSWMGGRVDEGTSLENQKTAF